MYKRQLSVGLATGSYGLSFGALAVTAGLSVPQAMALSLLLFSGGSQFAVVNVLGAGGSGAAAVATSTMLGVRNGLYGIEVARLGVMQEQVTTGFWCVAPEERMLLCLLRIRKSSVMTWLPWPGAVAPG